MSNRFAVVSAIAPLQERITFPQNSPNWKGSPPKLFGGHAPLASSIVFDGNAVHPMPVGKPVLAETVTPAEPITFPEAAEIVAVPAATPLACPSAPTVAAPVFDDDQTTACVTSCMLPSVSVPVAVNWTGAPTAIAAFTGNKAIDTRLGTPTVRVVEVFTAPDAAPIVVPPFATDVAMPEVLMVATPVSEEVQRTALVKS